MKTSHKFFIAAVLLMIVNLALYDQDLRHEWLNGDYRDPYRNFVPIDFKHFSAIRLNAGSAANIILVQGPFKILASPTAVPMLRLRQVGDTLIIDAEFSFSYRNTPSTYVLYIACPTLTSVQIDTYYQLDKVRITDTLASEDFSWKRSVIQGFTIDSLQLYADHAANIECRNDTIASLQAVIGASVGSAANFIVGKDNKINQSHINVLNKSRLWLQDTGQAQLHYHIADSGRLILNGRVDNKFKF